MNAIGWVALVLSLVSVALNVRLLWRDRREISERVAKLRKSGANEKVVVRYSCAWCEGVYDFAFVDGKAVCPGCLTETVEMNPLRVKPEKPRTILIYEHESFKSKGKRA